MEIIFYDADWTPISIAEEALHMAFPFINGLRFLTKVVTQYVVEYHFPNERVEPQFLIVVAGMTDLGPATVLIHAVVEMTQTDHDECIPVTVQVRTASRSKGKIFDSTCFEIRPKK